jgi:UDP-N-acetylmuramoyl-L-alanyl-D-glutamate--2,6-diaminopimelate ligase
MMAAVAATAMTVGELLGAAAGTHANLQVTDLVLDSRQVTPGAAFVAVPGGREHGLKYARAALASGAAVVVYEPSEGRAAPEPSVAIPHLRQRLGELAKTFYCRDAAPRSLFGVTGTNGKSTVAFLVAQALTGVGRRCGYIGTLGYGVPPTLSAHALTTPDCFTLHRELRALDTRYAAMEVSSHALEQDRIAGLELEAVAFTNLTRDHLDHHGDLERYADAKARLFGRPEIEWAILNLDDPYAAGMRARLHPGARILGVTLHDAPAASVSGRLERAGLDGVDVAIGGRYGRARVHAPLIGDFNAENLLIALGALLALDVPLQGACEALGRCAAPPGRMELHVGASDQPRVVIDYAHTPAALERVLGVLQRVTAGAVWCVFGCGGDRDRGKRPLMGAVAARLAEHIVLTDDNPRSEDPAAIIAAIRAGIGTHPDVTVEHDRAAAIARAVARASAEDVVLVAGKGHEASQIVGTAQRPFSDANVAQALLEGRA